MHFQPIFWSGALPAPAIAGGSSALPASLRQMRIIAAAFGLVLQIGFVCIEGRNVRKHPRRGALRGFRQKSKESTKSIILLEKMALA
jgi:hypothetical protein